MIADHISGGFTPTDFPALSVYPGDAADLSITNHVSGKFAIFNTAVIHTDNTADLVLASGWRYFPGYRKVADFGPFLYIPEQTCRRTVPRQFHIGDRKSAAIKNPPKSRNTEFTCHAQNNIVLQYDLFISGPAIQYAVLCQLPQIFLSADLYDRIILFF